MAKQMIEMMVVRNSEMDEIDLDYGTRKMNVI